MEAFIIKPSDPRDLRAFKSALLILAGRMDKIEFQTPSWFNYQLKDKIMLLREAQAANYPHTSELALTMREVLEQFWTDQIINDC